MAKQRIVEVAVKGSTEVVKVAFTLGERTEYKTITKMEAYQENGSLTVIDRSTMRAYAQRVGEGEGMILHMHMSWMEGKTFFQVALKVCGIDNPDIMVDNYVNEGGGQNTYFWNDKTQVAGFFVKDIGSEWKDVTDTMVRKFKVGDKEVVLKAKLGENGKWALQPKARVEFEASGFDVKADLVTYDEDSGAVKLAGKDVANSASLFQSALEQIGLHCNMTLSSDGHSVDTVQVNGDYTQFPIELPLFHTVGADWDYV